MRPSLGLAIFAAVLCAICIHKADAALAAMSIDLGAQFIKIGIVKPGVPMDIVLNKESRRKTPNVIAFKSDERFFAEAAAAMASSHPKSAYSFLLSLLAKTQGDEVFDTYKQTFPFTSFTFDETRNTVVFPYQNEQYNVETLLAMILWNAKKTTEAYAGQSVKDVVITVPIFLNQAERRAIATAADIAGLNLLQLLNDGSAAALNYGVFRRKEITETPQTMLIYDMGALKTTTTIVEYVLESSRKDGKDKQPVVRTIGVGYDRTLGGLEITTRLRDSLVKKFRETVKTNTDITTTARSMGKLQKEAERVKQVLSANKDTFAQVESLHEEHNFRVKVTREELEALIADLEPRVVAPITDALKMAEKKISEIDQIVLMGAGTRMPKVKEVLKNVFGDKEIGNFLNTDEAIALGAVYQAAHLSKSFKVLPFTVYELVLFPVEVNFLTKSESGELNPTSRTLFGYKSYYPTNNKIINFNSYDDDFDVKLSYGKSEHLSEKQKKQVGSDLSLVEIRGVKEALEKEKTEEKNEFKGVRTSFAIDLSGIVTVSKSNVVVETKPTEEELSNYETAKKEFDEWEKEQAELKKKEQEEKKLAKEKKEKDDNETTTEAPATEEKTETATEQTTTEEPVKKEKKIKPVEPKTKSVKVKLSVTEKKVDLVDLTKENVEASKKILANFEKVENEKHEREEAMNTLEGRIYDLAVQLEDGEEFAEFVTADEKKAIQDELTVLRAWYEDDVSIETKTEEFVERKKKLDGLTEKAVFRKTERLELPKVVEALDQAFNKSRIFHAMALNITEHETEDKTFSETEIEVLTKLIATTEEWWKQKQEAYVSQAKSEDPVVTASELAEKVRDLEREVRYLLNKMKLATPKKKKTEKKEKKDEKAESEKENDENAKKDEKEPSEDTKENEEEKKDPEEGHDAAEL